MMLPPPAGFDWPDPWEPLAEESRCLEYPQVMAEAFGGDEAAPSLAAELQRECCEAHPLYGRQCIPVSAARDDPNEFVFITDHPDFPIAFVHLTWSVEPEPTFPHTLGYDSWDAFKIAWQK